LVAALDTPGLHLVEAAGSRGVIAVNVGDPEVSNLARTSLEEGAGARTPAGRRTRPWWTYAVIAAFALAAAEWVTWQRRITV
jgi:hypothetical protein